MTPSETPETRKADSAAEYSRRLELHRTERARARKQDLVYSALRFAIFILIVLALIYTFSSESVPPWIALVPTGVLLVLVIFHGRCRRRMEQAERREAYYERGLARLKGEWAGRGESGASYAPEGHLYAEDLDLFGHGSLFELICAAGTGVGRQRLAEWLSRTADKPEAEARQEAVRELAGRLDLREDLALRGLELDAGLEPEALKAWATSPHPLANPALRIAACVIALLTAAAVAAWLFTDAGLFPFTALILVQLVFMWRLREPVTQVVRAASDAAAELRVLARLLERLEAESFDDRKLRDLKRAIEVEGLPPSRQVAKLVRRVDLLDQFTHNQLLMILALAFLGVPQAAMAIEGWRARVGPSIAGWLSAVGDFESLASLARFAYENPDATYPEIVDGETRFEAEGMAHPLLPAETRISNDLKLGEGLQLLLVSGSNMSGKSTLLRTVGVNVVLALAGAPVCAKRMKLSPLRLGASIRVQDSLLQGNSRFYAEISRIRGVVGAAAESPPLLFLMDEIFGGTNSSDRRVGAAAVIRTLIERGAIGLVTTHDLALSSIAEELGERAANVHFEDDFRDDKIYFDYRLKPGLLERGNALALMRSIGLEV